MIGLTVWLNHINNVILLTILSVAFAKIKETHYDLKSRYACVGVFMVIINIKL